MNNRGFIMFIPIAIMVVLVLFLCAAIWERPVEEEPVVEEANVTYDVLQGDDYPYVKIYVDGEFDQEVHYSDWFTDPKDNKRKWFYQIDPHTGEPVFLVNIEDVRQIERYENQGLPEFSIDTIRKLPNLIRRRINELLWELRRVTND